MALAATMVWEVRTTGDPANSGGFDSAAAGTDRSQQDAPHVIIDGVVITATVNATTTDLDVVGYVPVAADVGNTIRVAGGSATAGTYQITAVVAGRWRCDRAVGTAGQTAEGRMGGAGSDPALIAVVLASFNRVWQQAGTYPITSATQNVAGGCVNIATGGVTWEGYQTVRGDFGTRPVYLASGITTATLFNAGANDAQIYNIEADGATLVAIRGIVTVGRSLLYRCRARRCTNSGMVVGAQGSAAYWCEATLCTTAGAGILDNGGGQGEYFYGCSSHDNTVMGFSIGGATRADRCLSYANTGAATDGFQCATGADLVNCVAYGNGRDGFRMQGIGNQVRLANCLAEENGGIGFNGTGVNFIHLLFCGGFNNTGGNATFSNLINSDNLSFVTGTSSFFVNAAGGDFALNSDATGGTLVRANGLPTTFLDGISINFLDRGAVQHQDSGGGGGGGIGPVVGAVWGGGL